jgi:hypothetical protein
MKFFLPFILILFTTNVFAQSYSYKQFEPGSVQPKQELITEYIASNGESFKIGDEVFINEPSGNANAFQYIIKKTKIEIYYPKTEANGVKGKILKFKVVGTAIDGWVAEIVLVSERYTHRYIIKTELALKFKEIISSVLTREQAIAKLKESKDLLDLEMISLDDYNKIKAGLTPIIMKN